MLILVVIFLLLAFIAILPVILVMWPTEGSLALSNINKFISNNDATIMSIGVLALVSGLALLTTRISNRSSEKREISNRRVQSELKLVEFRQAWINEMRNDLARCSELLFHRESEAELVELAGLTMKIRMRLNLSEPLASELQKSIAKAYSASKSGDLCLENETLDKYIENSTNYLKSEWERLKRDIRNAQSLDEGVL